MKIVFNCIWSSITDNLWVSLFLLVSVIVSAWVTFAVQLYPCMRLDCEYDDAYCNAFKQPTYKKKYISAQVEQNACSCIV